MQIHRVTLLSADMLSQAVITDATDSVCEVDVDAARRAIALARRCGDDLTALLQTQKWAWRPHLILSIAFDGEDLKRACRSHAAWCAQQVEHLTRSTNDHTRSCALAAAHAARGAEIAEMRWASIYAADATLYTNIRGIRDAQQPRLIAIVLEALGGEE